MKILLVSLNAKYIHTALSLYYLKSVCSDLPHQIVVKEFTINGNQLDILGEIYREHADLTGFSCYIWNIEQTLSLGRMLKKVDPRVSIVLGGPEVSFDAEEIMGSNGFLDGVVVGEGELTFRELVQCRAENRPLDRVAGLVWRKDGGVVRNSVRPPIDDLDAIPFPFSPEDLAGFAHKIVYYETSRGCPFHCRYCLSSAGNGVRYFSLDRVKNDLGKLVRAGVKQVKLVDRTFNCRQNRAREIISYLLQIKVPGINFHFEIAGDLLDGETIDLMNQATPGYFQVEIGVQSTNPAVLEIIDRKMDFSLVGEAVKKLRRGDKVHLHLDLIAGLPEEDRDSFAQSFNDVYALHGHRIQLGFLKLLKGSGLREQAQEYLLVGQDRPPYEVVQTRALSFGELSKFKEAENAVEIYHNSGKYGQTLAYAVARHEAGPFDFFLQLGSFQAGYGGEGSPGLKRQGEILLSFLHRVLGPEKGPVCRDLMKLDYLLNERKVKLPLWLTGAAGSEPDLTREFLHRRENIERYLPHLKDLPPQKIYQQILVEQFSSTFSFDQEMVCEVKTVPCIILFDYTQIRGVFRRPEIKEIN